jgi:hypothetical protein
VPWSPDGTFAGATRLLGWFHLDRDDLLDHAPSRASSSHQPASGFVTAGDDSDGQGALAAQALFADTDFPLRGTSPGTHTRAARIQARDDLSTFDPTPPADHLRTVLTGTFDGLAPLLLMVAGTLLFFTSGHGAASPIQTLVK